MTVFKTRKIRRRRSAQPRIAGALAFVVFVCLSLILVDGWRSWTMRQTIFANAAINAQNLAHSIEQQATDTLEIADNIVSSTVAWLEAPTSSEELMAPGQNRRIELLRLFLDNQQKSSPRIRSISLVDADGNKTIATMISKTQKSANYSDRGYFIFHKNNNSRELHINNPVQSKQDGAWILNVSKRVNNPDGSFFGVVVVSLDLSYFTQFYKSFDTGQDGSITMSRIDGVVLARSPMFETTVGRDLPQNRFFQDMDSHGLSPPPLMEMGWDNHIRLVADRRLPHYPIIVSVSLSRDEILAPWINDLLAHLIGIIFLITIISVLGFRLAGQIARQAKTEARALHSEKQARRSEQFLHRVIDAAPEPIFIKDQDHRWLLVNQAFCALTGLPPQQLIGKTNHDVYPKTEADRFQIKEEEVFATGQEIINEEELTNAAGETRVVIQKKTVVTDEQNHKILIGMIFDITERKEFEEELRRTKDSAEAAARVKSEFLASMSHEIRTPLNGVLGFTDVLLRTDLTSAQRRYLQLQQDAGQGLLTVINDILDTTKLDAGELSIVPTVIDLDQLADSCTQFFGHLAQEKGLRLSLRLIPERQGFIHADGPRLRQILSNLLSNAIKFTRNGGVALTLQQIQDPATPRLIIEVSDSGIGIPRDMRDRLFQPFSQVDGSIAREFGGTGLGLAISRRLARLMKGEISVESERGIGSTFTVDLPLERAADPLPAAPPELDREIGMSSPMILVAEDNEINQRLIEALLYNTGYQLDLVANGAEAVAAVTQKTYDVILMDMQMPVMDGMKATRPIRGLAESLGSVPIIALTANVLPEEIALCYAAGMNGHVGKPIDRAALIKAIETALRTKQVA